MLRGCWFVLAAASLAWAQNAIPPAANQKIDFARDIAPLL
jgi:hypothetical protein